MASSTAAYIYTGPWINWSHGHIRGATLTLSRDSGGLLIAFLAVFVGLAGTCFWNILCYFLHQSRAVQEKRDALHLQQQVIFCNNAGPAATACEFLRLGWCWRNAARSPFWRSLPFVLLASLNLAVFGVASIYTSEITKAPGNESLIRGSQCGLWHAMKDDSREAEYGHRSKMLSDAISAASYARSCYNNTENILECNQYINQQIKWTVNANASCPFDPGRCMIGENAAYEMDTGPIDSHLALGINAPQKDRVTYRKRVTCAPIFARDVARVENMTDQDERWPGEQFVRYYFGPITGLNNWTYQYNARTLGNRFDYSLHVFRSSLTSRVWEPIAQMNRTDAAVSLHFLSANDIQYTAPVDDPWFSAHDEVSFAELTLWAPDNLIRVLGCIEQQQLCSVTDSRQCTALGDLQLSDIHALELNSAQLGTARRLFLTQQRIYISASTDGRGGLALRAQEKVSVGFGEPLPNNQWQIEASHWMAISMARLQRGVVEWASGPTNLPPGIQVGLPSDIPITSCFNQKVRHLGDHASFSILGMVIILAVGGTIILLSLVADQVGGLLQRLLGRGIHRQRQWIINEKLQLLRLVYERAGEGAWSGSRHRVPLTEPGQMFGILEEQDLEETIQGVGTTTATQQKGGEDYSTDQKSKNAASYVTEVSPLVQ